MLAAHTSVDGMHSLHTLIGNLASAGWVLHPSGAPCQMLLPAHAAGRATLKVWQTTCAHFCYKMPPLAYPLLRLLQALNFELSFGARDQLT